MNIKKNIVTFIFLAFIGVLAILLFALPKSDYSQNEKRVLADFPEVSFESITSGEFSTGIDTYTADQFPFRDFFVGINSYYELLTGRNGVSGVYKCKDGYLIATPQELDEELCKRNVERFAEFAKQQGLPSTLMVVPTAGYIMEEELPANHVRYEDDKIFDIIQENKGELNFIDLRDTFQKSKENTQLYYKTDRHLTSAGAYVMYQQFCKQNGIEPVTEFSEKEILKDFYGTNYSKSGLWMEKPDEVEIWHSASGNQFEVTIDDSTEKQTYDSLYFYEHDKNMDKYPVFLDGNHSLVTVRNKDCHNGKKLLIIKDSFAHCFTTFLCEDYEEIYMIDLRYYRNSVSDFIEQNEVNELLYLYGADNISSSTDTAWLQ